MRGVSKRFAVLLLLFLLGAPSAFASPDDRGGTLPQRVKHLIVTILDQLGVPLP